ncbi:MAG TPA: hypothetical protein PKC39_11465 [Ferruginibacter sp.]|nr:hypothetical protein [Ferruginibacter sp.]HMP21567.1 hypothetical protein [Ferruginibacter sp.]
MAGKYKQFGRCPLYFSIICDFFENGINAVVQLPAQASNLMPAAGYLFTGHYGIYISLHLLQTANYIEQRKI